MNRNEKDKTSRSVFPDGTSIAEHKSEKIRGIVKVHESVIASIIRKAACSVDGVVRLAGNTLVDNIAEFVGNKKVMDRAISIEMGDNSVKIEIRIILAYGCKVPEVAANVQSTVIEEIARITGMQVPRIDIVVMDLEDPNTDEDEEENVQENE